MIKTKKESVYNLKPFEHIGDMQKMTFEDLNKENKKEGNVRNYVSGFAKKNEITLYCGKGDDHFKVIRTK